MFSLNTSCFAQTDAMRNNIPNQYDYPDLAKKQMKCQSHTIAEQMANGYRYFDLRIMYDQHAPESLDWSAGVPRQPTKRLQAPMKRLRFSHDGYATDFVFQVVYDAAKAFLQTSKNEVLIFKVKHEKNISL